MQNVLESADTMYMLGALKQLGIPIVEDKETKTVTLTGLGGSFNSAEAQTLFLGEYAL